MRIDLALKQTGIIKRRTIAKQFCERGLVMVNGKTVKPSFEIKSDDICEIKLGEKIAKIKFIITTTPKREFVSYEAAD